MSDYAVSIEKNPITEDKILPQILKLFFPLFLGTLFQQLYTTFDAVIVGKVLGKQALAAVGGGTATVIELLIGFLTGLSNGATVVIAQYYGAKNESNVSKSVHNAVAFAIICGILVSVAGFLTAPALLHAISVPSDVYPLALQYIRIYYCGVIMTVLFNMGSGIFRAIGDSKSPLLFLIIGTVANIIMDILFVAVLNLGVAGAAWATVASQAIALVFVVIRHLRLKDCSALVIRKIKIHPHILRRTIRIGLPSGLQSVMYTITNILIVGSINAFGTDTCAGWSAYTRLDSFFFLIANAMSLAMTTFIGQNYGASRIDRCKRGTFECLGITSLLAITISVIYAFLGSKLFLLFTSDSSVISQGMLILRDIAPFYIAFVPCCVFSGTAKGCGKTFVTMALTLFGICIFRIIWVVTVAKSMGTLHGITMCYGLSWILTAVLYSVFYFKGSIYSKQN